MKAISIFNNKGGVGKSTLSFHLAHALAARGKKTLLVDLDPQSNLTLQCIESAELEKLWNEEETYIQDFQTANESSTESFSNFLKSPRSIHCLLKPVEDGVFDSFEVGTIREVAPNLGLIAGRLSLHTFEDKIAKSWSDAFMGEPQALRLLSAIRSLCLKASELYGYEIAILDTSPSLGMMNRIIISTSNGFFVPCMPDMFSTFGITNIGQALRVWQNQFDTLYKVLTDKKRSVFPENFVKFLGYTIYNAKKYASGNNEYDLAAAHYEYAKRIPNVISSKIPKDCYSHLSLKTIKSPIGGVAIMHSHNTPATMAQKYRKPIWQVPELADISPDKGGLAPEDRGTILGNKAIFLATKEKYDTFAIDLLNRLEGVVA